MTENLLVSIIVRTKDRPELVKRALASIAAQTYRPLEVVLVNDGGCDLEMEELKAILGDITLTYRRLEKNVGRAGAANAGVENAKGEYAAFLDDDDIYYPAGITSLVGAARLRGDAVVYGKVVCKKYTDSGALVEADEDMLGGPFDPGRLVFENFIPFNSLLFPGRFFQKTGPFDSAFEIYEDWDWILRLSELCEFHFTDAVVAEYSVHGSATITGKGGAPMQNYFRERLLQKHIHKAQAKHFLAYLKSVIDRVVLEKEKRIHSLSYELQDKDEELRRLREGVAWLEGNLKVRDDEARLRDEELQRLREGIAWLQGNLKTKDEEALVREEEARARDEELQRLREGVAWLEGKLGVKEAEIERLASQRRELEKRLGEVLSSESWRLTKPLRVLGSAIRKIAAKKNS